MPSILGLEQGNLNNSEVTELDNGADAFQKNIALFMKYVTKKWLFLFCLLMGIMMINKIIIAL